MRLAGAVLLAAGLASTPILPPPQPSATASTSDAFSAMVDAERAFAGAAKQRGVRAAFLEYLDDDAIGFEPSLGRAKEAWRARPVPADPLATTLSWQPRAGDISESGDLGWLTGPYVFVPNGDIAHTQYGCYFSIWIRRAGAPWRVLIDAGVSTEEPCAFPGEGAARLTPTDSPPPTAAAGLSKSTLLEQDWLLDTRAVTVGLADAFGPLLFPAARFNREGKQPLLGSAAITPFLSSQPGSWTFVPRGGEVASSGDLGYTYGDYDLKENIRTTEAGYYVRVWRRFGARLAGDVRDTRP